MKKRYLVVTLFVMLLLFFLPFAFSAGTDIWVECKTKTECSNENSKCEDNADGACCGVNDKPLTISGTPHYCCDKGGYVWQNAACCTDSDGDGYKVEGGDCGEIDCDDRPKGADNTPGTADDGANINPGKTEVCNGIDDNCDGSVDEGWADYTTRPSNDNQNGVCLGSKKKCSSGVWAEWLGIANIADYEATEIKCTDEKDNDCDGTWDNNQGDNSDSDCCIYTGTETCNNIDDDCDGLTDEGLSQTVSCGTGACSRSQAQTCSAGLWSPACTPGTAGTETCNGVDDDCDGSTDEGYVSSATSCGVGACASTGQTSCVSGQVRDSCTPGTAGTETCNGVDDDCDGIVDDSLTAPPCANQAGVCTGSVKTCGGASGWLACTAASYGSNYQSTETICGDGNDNDCDGLPDCVDSGCAGKSGPGSSKCCQPSSVSSDCSSLAAGNCGSKVCTTSNICDVAKNTNLCPATKGACGTFLKTCSKNYDGSFTCDYIGNNDLCTCDQACGATYSCAAIDCKQPFLTYSTCINMFPNGVNCGCHGCTTCPSTSYSGSKGIGSVICS